MESVGCNKVHRIDVLGKTAWHGIWLFAACVLCTGGSLLPAAVPYYPKLADPLLDAWRWQRFIELDGTGPQHMAEDADGAMWFGLTGGVMRYDGVKWKRYGEGEGLPTGVNIFHLAKDGAFYAGTETGIFRFTGDRWERFFPADTAAKFRVSALISAKDGTLWASGEKYLLRLRGAERLFYVQARQLEKQQAAFPGAHVLPFPKNVPVLANIATLMEDRTGLLWFDQRNGTLGYLDPSASNADAAWRIFSSADGFYRRGWTPVLHQASDGLIWVADGGHNGLVHRYDLAANKWTSLDLKPIFGTDSIIRSICETSDGAVWLGGLGKLFRYKDEVWQLYRSPEIPLSSSRFSLLESRSQDLWVLGGDDEVQRVDFRGKRWLRYEGLNFQCETPNGRQWFLSADNGVVCFDGATWSRFGVDDGLIAKPCALLCTRKGELWVAGSHDDADAAIARFDGTKWIRVPEERTKFDLAAMIDYRAVVETPDESVWFGAYTDAIGTRRDGKRRTGGILQYNPALGAPEDERAWILHHQTAYIGSNISVGFALGKDGTLYNGLWTGPARYDGQRWDPYLPLGSKIVDAMAHSSRGDVWFGTQGMGLYQLTGDKPSLVQHTIADGLCGNAVTALFSDRDDHLWAATGKGISRFDGKEWITDVFPDARISMGTEGGGFRQSRDGSVWINQSSRDWMRRALPGGKLHPGAVGNFWTVRFRADPVPPKTTITTALTEVSQPGNTVITWRGVDPWWKTPENDLRYSYRFDGGPWSEFGSATNHAFLQLPTGRHTFEVRARDHDLNVETAPARTEFEVMPPVWRQGWFLALMGVLTASIATQTYRVIRHAHSLQKANRELEDNTELLEENARKLEDEIEERKQMEIEIEKTHKQLLVASRQAGMAEIATSVLHNVGNVLNSVNVSATVIADKTREFKIAHLAKTAELLQEHAAEPQYLTSEKGKLIPRFLKNLGEHFASIQETSIKELGWLQRNIDHIKEIVAMQQTYARVTGLVEKVKISEMAEDAVRINAGALIRHEVELVRDYRDDAEIEVEKNKVLQILVNLIRNAKYACDESGRTDKRIILRIARIGSDRMQIAVIDNGVGIPPENMTRIFNHGFTTRKDGHGFGLHSAANTATTLRAQLTAHSEGLGRGAMFVLSLPSH